MINKSLVKIMILSVVVFFLGGCSLSDNQNISTENTPNGDTEGITIENPEGEVTDQPTEQPIGGESKHQLVDGSTLIVRSDKFEKILSISLQSQDGEKMICEKDPSIPAISPDKSKVAYIDVFAWEEIGNVYIYDVLEGKSEMVIEQNIDFEKEYTPKKLVWMDDERLLVVIGYAYGTASVGGDLYVYDIREEKLSLVISPEDYNEIKDVRLNKNEIILEYAEFSGDMTEYTTKNVLYSKEDILELIRK